MLSSLLKMQNALRRAEYLPDMTKKELAAHIKHKGSCLCVGLDPDLSKIPSHIASKKDAVLQFNKTIIDATAEHCVAFKPNLAFYECLGVEGWKIFHETVEYIRDKHERHFIIADAKRGDIGNTSAMYAEAFFSRSKCDAVTVTPYMGEDSIKPFLNFPGKWTIVLGLTSNKGAEDLQLKKTDGKFLYETLISKALTWGTKENMMFVVGATRPETLKEIRILAPDHFFLIPGVGAQGGDLDAVLKNGMNAECGILVNSSRNILYAGSGEDFAAKAKEEAARIHAAMKISIGSH